MRNHYAVAPSIEEKHFDFFLNRPSWHKAFFRRIGIVQSKGKGESEQEQARQILSGLCALFVCMAKKLYAPNSGKTMWAPLYYVSSGAVDTMLFVNETNMHVHDRIFNNTLLRPYVIGDSCVVCATFRVMKQFFRSVEDLITSNDILSWEKQFTESGGGESLRQVLQTMIKNPGMYGMSVEMVEEAKRCRDFIGILNDMTDIPQKIVPFKPLSGEKGKKAPISSQQDRKKQGKPTKVRSESKPITLPETAKGLSNIDAHIAMSVMFMLLDVMISCETTGQILHSAGDVWREVQSQPHLRPYFSEQQKQPNFSGARTGLRLFIDYYSLPWSIDKAAYRLIRTRKGAQISRLKKLRDLLNEKSREKSKEPVAV